MFEVICIDDAVKPNDIPTSAWVKKGERYTVIGVYKMNMQPGIFGYELKEKDLSPYPPYRYFAHVRFEILELNSSIKEVKEETPELELA